MYPYKNIFFAGNSLMDNELDPGYTGLWTLGCLPLLYTKMKCLIDNLLSPSSVGSHPNVFNVTLHGPNTASGICIVMCTVVHDINKVQLFVTSSIVLYSFSVCIFIHPSTIFILVSWWTIPINTKLPTNLFVMLLTIDMAQLTCNWPQLT